MKNPSDEAMKKADEVFEQFDGHRFDDYDTQKRILVELIALALDEKQEEIAKLKEESLGFMGMSEMRKGMYLGMKRMWEESKAEVERLKLILKEKS